MRPLTEKGEWGAKTKKVYVLDENGKRVPLIDKKTGKQEVQSLLQDGEKATPQQWKAEIQSLQAEYDSIGKEKSKTATELAYAEVISYNRKNLERELRNESRQKERQQGRGKRRGEEI